MNFQTLDQTEYMSVNDTKDSAVIFIVKGY